MSEAAVLVLGSGASEEAASPELPEAAGTPAPHICLAVATSERMLGVALGKCPVAPTLGALDFVRLVDTVVRILTTLRGSIPLRTEGGESSISIKGVPAGTAARGHALDTDGADALVDAGGAGARGVDKARALVNTDDAGALGADDVGALGANEAGALPETDEVGALVDADEVTDEAGDDAADEDRDETELIDSERIELVGPGADTIGRVRLRGGVAEVGASWGFDSEREGFKFFKRRICTFSLAPARCDPPTGRSVFGRCAAASALDKSTAIAVEAEARAFLADAWGVLQPPRSLIVDRLEKGMIASMVTTALVTKACRINELVCSGGRGGGARCLPQVDAPVVERLEDVFAPGNLEVSAGRKHFPMRDHKKKALRCFIMRFKRIEIVGDVEVRSTGGSAHLHVAYVGWMRTGNGRKRHARYTASLISGNSREFTEDVLLENIVLLRLNCFSQSCNGFICNDYFHASAFLEFLFCIPVLLGNEMPVPEKLAEWLVEVLIGPGTICLHIFPENQQSPARTTVHKRFTVFKISKNPSLCSLLV
ncbi:hypothetical protein B0H14DRAFT_2658446 [Mycena olivaceomarginata]|nr:hypothetical protein B0H14DRAFT_2658446 [Mycena olivaceomarginata]